MKPKKKGSDRLGNIEYAGCISIKCDEITPAQVTARRIWRELVAAAHRQEQQNQLKGQNEQQHKT